MSIASDKGNRDLARWVMEQARKAGASASAVRIHRQREVQVEVRDGRVDRLQESTSRSLGLDLYVDGRYSVHTTQKLDRTALQGFVADATALTRYLAPDPHRRLPEAELSRLEEVGDLQQADAGHDSLETHRRIELAKAAVAAARACPGPFITATADYRDREGELLLVNSAGFEGQERRTLYNLSVSITAKDGDRGRPEAYAYTVSRHLADLAGPEAIGKEASGRAVAMLGQTKLPSGKYDLVLENRIAGQLLSSLLGAMSAGAIQQKSSFLEGRLGQAIASPLLTVQEDPFLPRGLSSSRFDDEGIAAHRRTLIEKGVLKTYLMDNYYARKLGQKPNSGDVTNLLFPGGKGSLESLLKTMDRGILVQGFIGGNHNATTGDFSYGLTGQYVENGRVQKPVNEMNLSGNLLEVWKQLEALGGDPDPCSSWRLPSLLFRGLHLSGA